MKQKNYNIYFLGHQQYEVNENHRNVVLRNKEFLGLFLNYQLYL